MILLIGGEKGGVGKSTLACNLAIYLTLQKKTVFLLDADPQKTTSIWIKRRLLKNIINSNIPSKHEIGDIQNKILTLNKQYEYVIVDTGGRDSKELRSSLIVSDILCAPIKPSQVDIDTLDKLNELVKNAKLFNTKLVSYAVITHAPTNPHMEDKKETEDVLKTMLLFSSVSTVLSYRASYWRSMADGLSVLEYSDNKAKNEIITLGKMLFTF